ncbi:hypothetical protein ACFY8B_21525 [Streptomyces sp. NPDC012751]|uniref:hypothetical protein n=1 Tax=Streptomyces sp. NPDC012751 TaxID=3364846 RepID=UPI0036BB85CF
MTAPLPRTDPRRGVPHLTARRAGNAWLIHPMDALDQRSWMYAAGLARDPEGTLVVVDTPKEPSPDFLPGILRALPPGRSELRLLFGRTPPGGVARAGKWLAARSGRVVVTTTARPRPTAQGALFVGPDRGPGWTRYTPAGDESPAGRRFPRPSWEDDLPDGPVAVSPWSQAEPIPAGLWLRPAGPTPVPPDHRTLVTTRLRSRPDAVTVVLGLPGDTAVPLADVARLWQALPGHLRSAIWFCCFGPVALPPGTAFDAALAAAVGGTVRSYNGLPVSPTPREPIDDPVMAVGGDGSLGRPLMTHELVRFPPQDAARDRDPMVTGHRWPVEGLPLLRPGVYQRDPDTVLEVLRCGLWVRGPQEPAGDGPRFLPVDRSAELVLYDTSDTSRLPAFRRLAKEIAQQVFAAHGVPVQVRTAPRAPLPQDSVPPSATSGPPARPVTGPAHGTSASGTAVRRAAPLPEQSERRQTAAERDGTGRPGGAATVRPTLDDWLRGAFGARYEECTSFVEALIRQRASALDTRAAGDPVAELAALRLYLLRGGHMTAGPETAPDSGAGRGPERGLERELRRRLASGLRRLPAFRGPVTVRVSLPETGLAWYRARSTLTDGDWCATTMSGRPGQPGDTDVVILSADGRCPALLGAGDPDVVVFPPGTRFARLHVESGERGTVLLRQLPAGDTAPDPQADRDAVRRLRRALADWRRDESAGVLRTGQPGRLFRAPGTGTAAEAGAADG